MEEIGAASTYLSSSSSVTMEKISFSSSSSVTMEKIRAASEIFLRSANIGELNHFKRLAEALDHLLGIGVPEIVENTKDEQGRCAMHHAAAGGSVNVLRYLIEEMKLDVDVKDGKGETPISWAAIEGRLAAVEYLLQMGANPEIIPNDSAEKGRKDIIPLLLSKSMNVDTMDNFEGPLHCATSAGKHDTVKVLMDNGANGGIVLVRHGSCNIILRNSEGVMLASDSIELLGGRTISGVEKFSIYGNAYAVFCGNPVHYNAVNRHLKQQVKNNRRENGHSFSARQLSEMTSDFCRPTIQHPTGRDCEFMFGSIDPNPDWVSYGPPLPIVSPSAWRANSTGASEVLVNSWWCEGSSSHVAEESLCESFGDKPLPSLDGCVKPLTKAMVEASAMPCTGGKITVVKITVLGGIEKLFSKDADVLALELQE